ncbi:MAG: hypothetical protein R3Y07_03560, partial [Eubacteriales bacterium]
MMREELKQDEYFVAFLDILGYSNKLKKLSDSDADIYLENIREILTSKHLERLKKSITRDFSFKSMDLAEFEFRLFSDNILIFIKKTSDNNDNLRNCFALLKIVMSIQKYAFTKKHILLRGGIASGLFKPEQDFVFGKALIRAYELEQLAIYPRIILEKTEVDFLVNTISELKDINEKQTLESLLTDLVVLDNETYFLNFFSGLFINHDENAKFSNIFTSRVVVSKSHNAHYTNVDKNILISMCKENGHYDNLQQESVSSRNKTIQKLLWLLEYYNICCLTSIKRINLKVNYQIINDPIHHLPKIVLL